MGKLNKRKILAAICIVTGIVIMAVPLYWHLKSDRKTEELIMGFEQEVEVLNNEREENSGQEEGENTISEAYTALLPEGDVIGVIEIPSLGIRNPVMEGTGQTVLNAGIGHMPGTAGIGEKGNCVLCGHNGSRHGKFFTPLSQAKTGDIVSLFNKKGEEHLYEVAEMYTVGPYDNSIKTQSDSEELTLFTCAQKGTKRFVVKCVPIKEAADE